METNWEVCRKLIKNCGRATIAWPCYEVRSRSGHAADAENKRWRRPCTLAAPCTLGRRHPPIKRAGSRRRQPAPYATWTARKTFLLEAFWNKFAPCTLQTAWLLIPRHDSLLQGGWQAHPALVDRVHAWPHLSLGMRGYIRASSLATTCVLVL